MAELTVPRQYTGIIVTENESSPLTVVLESTDLPRVSGRFESEIPTLNGTFSGTVHGRTLTVTAQSGGHFQGDIFDRLILGTASSADSTEPQAAVVLFPQRTSLPPIFGLYHHA